MSMSAVASLLLLIGAPIGAGAIPPAALAPSPVLVELEQDAQAAPAPVQPAPVQSEPAVAPPQTPPPAPEKAAPASQGGDIVVTARPDVPGDPLQQVNAESFEVTQKVDHAVVGPVALTYKRVIPRPIRTGVRNVLNNLREPVVFLNFLLQLKPGKAFETVGRFSVNSTVGVGGLIDVAKKRPFNLPRRPNGFANTMGYYGVKPGPFLFLPLVGPTTLRDLIGGGLDRLVLPIAVGTPFTKPYYSIPTGVFSALDYRAEFDDELNKLRNEYRDPYSAARSYYLNRRQAEIDALHGMGRKTPGPAITPVESVLAPQKPLAPLPADEPAPDAVPDQPGAPDQPAAQP